LIVGPAAATQNQDQTLVSSQVVTVVLCESRSAAAGAQILAFT